MLKIAILNTRIFIL